MGGPTVASFQQGWEGPQRRERKKGKRRQLLGAGLGSQSSSTLRSPSFQPRQNVAQFLALLATMALAAYPTPPTPDYEIVGGRLRGYEKQWSSSDPFLGSIVRDGVWIQWADGAPARFDAGESTFSRSASILVQDEVDQLLTKGAIYEIPLEDSFFVTTIFLVDKKGGSYRPVLNLKPLNIHTAPKHFKMEGMPVVRDSLQENDWMCTVDLSDAFFHVPLHPGTFPFSFLREARVVEFSID
jgi:hypothetical protein